jgi:hypothetical protein
MRLAPLFGVLQDDAAPMNVDNGPFFDLVQGAKAAEAGKVIVQAAISYTWRWRGVVGITHFRVAKLQLQI